MSKADFDTVKADFFRVLDTAQSLAQYGAPLESRQKQMKEVGDAAVSYS